MLCPILNTAIAIHTQSVAAMLPPSMRRVRLDHLIGDCAAVGGSESGEGVDDKREACSLTEDTPIIWLACENIIYEFTCAAEMLVFSQAV